MLLLLSVSSLGQAQRLASSSSAILVHFTYFPAGSLTVLQAEATFRLVSGTRANSVYVLIGEFVSDTTLLIMEIKCCTPGLACRLCYDNFKGKSHSENSSSQNDCLLKANI